MEILGIMRSKNIVFQPKVRTNVIKNEYSDLISVLNKSMMNKMRIKNRAEVFLTLMSLLIFLLVA
jgi:hypothetical protein